MKIEKLKTIVGLALFIVGACTLMLGSAIPGYGKLIAVAAIILGIVILITKKNINFESFMGGHTGGCMRDDDD